MVEGLGSVDATLAEARRVFALQSAYKWLAKTSSVNERKEHLRRLRDEVVRRSADIERAIITDLPQPPSRDVPREVGFMCGAIDQTLEELEVWARPVKVEPSADLRGTEPSIVYEARGVCLIFGPWNLPFHLLFEPTVAALAAGNTAIVKPNSLTPATARVIGEIVQAVFEERLVAAFEGDDSVADVLLDLPVDHIFFTGSPAVGKVIMAAAARHLASVTLELGGKSPAIVDGTHDLAESARIVADGRHTNGGQMCFAVDYVWVRREVLEPFLAHYNAWVDENLYSDGRLNPASMTRIVNERNLERVLSMVEDARARGARVVRGGGRAPGYRQLIEPTVVLDAPLDSLIMTQEIFGPVLPVQTFVDPAEVLSQIQAGPKPLAMYIYSDDEAFVTTMLAGTSSGGVTVNGFASHVAEYRIPFGGVNNSGTGRYHGIHGFREFSNPRSVVRVITTTDAASGS
jgi:aldehyde dehydrogenase (NAD+)